jgi:hypothetical protein
MERSCIVVDRLVIAMLLFSMLQYLTLRLGGITEDSQAEPTQRTWSFEKCGVEREQDGQICEWISWTEDCSTEFVYRIGKKKGCCSIIV